jgi:hypothetical protein
MSVLLIQSCSKSKNQPEGPVPALDLYSGFFFKIIKKAMRENVFDERIDISILSAEHGLIDAETEIEWYDRRMDSNRAKELAPAVRRALRNQIDDSCQMIIVNVGNTYQLALEGIESNIRPEVYHVEGDGIGRKGHLLKKVIRGDLQAVKPNPIAAEE